MGDFRDRDLIAKIEGSRRRLIDKLSEEFPLLQLGELRQACEALESELVQYLVDTASSNADVLFQMRKSSDGLNFVDDHGSVYQLVSAQDVRDRSRLIVFLRPVAPGQSEQPSRFTVEVEGYGACRQIDFLYLRRDAYRVNFSLLRHWFKSIFESAYHWFFEVASSVTNYQLADLASRLYNCARKYVPRDTLGVNLWFSVMVNGYGFRLIEPHVASQAFRIIDTHNAGSNYSTNRYVAELLGTFLPEGQMLMREAIDHGVCVDVDMSATAYRKQGSIYALSLTALYGHESFTIYPVFNGLISIGAVFPTEMRASLEPILDEIVGDLAELCRNYREPSGTALKIFTSSAYMIV